MSTDGEGMHYAEKTTFISEDRIDGNLQLPWDPDAQVPGYPYVTVLPTSQQPPATGMYNNRIESDFRNNFRQFP